MAELSEIEDFIRRDQARAISHVAQSIDDSPDDAARAVQLGKVTGTDPSIIHGDLENFDRQNKVSTATSIVNDNQFIKDWVNTHPINAKLASDDYGNLDAASMEMAKLRSQSMWSRAIEHFKEASGYGEEGVPLYGSWLVGSDKARDEALAHPLIYSVLSAAGAPLETIARVATGLTQTATTTAGEIAAKVTGDPQYIQFGKQAGEAALDPGIIATLGPIGWPMGLMRGLSAADAIKFNRTLRRMATTAEPYLRAGKEPPLGVDPAIDQLKIAESEADLKKLMEALKASQKSALRERSPDHYADFARDHVGEQTIGIHADALRELYGEKRPEPDDGIIGFLPNAEQKLQAAEATGGYVDVPLADFWAKFDPEVAKQVEDFIRPTKDGVSRAEAKAMVEAYHGSPYEFEAFMNEKIGTGEGAQAYGYGHYVAENPAVAESYIPEDISGMAKAYGMAEPERYKGNLYRVRIHRDPEEFLDWDKPYAEQPENVKAVLKKQNDLIEQSNNPDFTMHQILRSKSGADALREAGIPGIRYLDQGSRGAIVPASRQHLYKPWGGELDVPKPTYNYVVFDPRDLEITHRNDVEIVRQAAGTETSTKLMAESMPKPAQQRGFIYHSEDGSELHIVPTDQMSAAERDVASLALQTAQRILGEEPLVAATDKIKYGATGSERISGINITEEGLAPIVAYVIGSGKENRVVRHEAIHQLINWGLITPEELSAVKEAALAKNAQGKDWLDKHNIRQRYAEHKMDEDALVEEAFAEEFAEWADLHEKADKQVASYGELVDQVFEKVYQFFDQLYQRLEQYFGHPPQVKDLFERIETGEVGKRARAKGEPSAKVAEPELPGVTRMEDRAAFEAANAIGMTQDQYRRYMKLIEKRQKEDIEASAKRALEEQRKKQTAEWKKNYAELRPQVVDQLNNRPDIAGYKLVTDGTLFGDTAGVVRLGENYLSEEQRSVLPKSFVAKSGANPDDIAGLVGHSSGDALVQSLIDLDAQQKASGLNRANFFRRLVDTETERQMEEKHGKLGDQILQEAKEQVLSETQLDLLHEETLAMGLKAGAEFSITKSQMKQWAEDRFKALDAGEVDSDRFIADAGRAGRAAEDALLKNDPAEGFRQRQRQYIATLFAKSAVAFEKERAKFEKTADRFSAREISNVEQEYTDFIHDIFTKVGLPVKRSLQDIQENIERQGNTDLRSFVASKEAALRELHTPEWLMDPAFRKPLDKLSVNEFLQLKDAVDALVFNGREERKVLRAGAKADLEAVLEDMAQSLEDFDLKSYPIDRKHPISDKIKSLWWSGITLESMFNRLDRGKPGVFFDTIVRVYNEAGIYKDRLMREYQSKVAEVGKIPNMDKVVDNTLWIDPITKQAFQMRRRNVLGILQNVGNASNLKKLAEGYGLEPAEVMRWVFDHTTKEDWDRAQKIGDIFEELFEKANTMSHNISGIGIERLPIEPIDTPYGSYRGWYNPIKYDIARPGSSKELLGRGIEDEGYYKATTPQGYTKGRTGYIAPVELNLDIVPIRMKQMVHDIAMRPAIIQLSKFFYNPKFERMITNRYGLHQAKEMVPFLRDIANVANFKSLAESNGDAVIEGLRQNIIAVLIGFNPGTVMKHGTTALLNSMNEVGVANWSREFMNIAKDLPAGRTDWRMAMEKSEELQRRMRNFSELIEGHGSEINLRGARTNFQSFRDFAISAGATPVSISDLLSAVPTWLAKYKSELADGSDEGTAVAMANRSVRLAHGSSNITNKPSIMRSGGPIKQTFTSLYGFFSHMLNKQYEMAWRAADAASDVKQGNYAQAAKQMPRLVNMFVAYVVLPAVIEEAVTPYTNADRESWGLKAAKILGLGLSSSLIGVRDAVHALVNARDPQAGLLATWMKASTDLGRDVFSVAGGKPMSREMAGRMINHGTTAFGALTGLTNAQEGRAAEYMYRWYNGLERPKGPWDAVVGLRFGKTGKHSRSFDEWQRHTFGGR